MGKTVVVVDDDLDVLLAVSIMLRILNYDVIHADNVITALRAIRLTPPDVVLTDLNMPLLGGADLIHALRTDPETEHLPVVVMTGFPQSSCFDEIPISGWISKPCSKADLEKAIRQATTRHRTVGNPRRNGRCPAAGFWSDRRKDS